MTRTASPELTVLFDGGCPLCVREVTFLKGRDRRGALGFVDIDAHVEPQDGARRAGGDDWPVARLGRHAAVTTAGWDEDSAIDDIYRAPGWGR